MGFRAAQDNCHHFRNPRGRLRTGLGVATGSEVHHSNTHHSIVLACSLAVRYGGWGMENGGLDYQFIRGLESYPPMR